ncbi:hypothetical protein SteCoe_30541 [Stentor coeruleus]|uniref:Uncharacterized protein n=1 Tax=Stentor coeruleus TaxID=5963 RepID=A0A1R2B3E6_9CILI|nr:hypothetical protein SteCoe_30541 [Stentor coeruleus]
MAENHETSISKIKTGYPETENITGKIPEGIQLSNVVANESTVIVSSLAHDSSFYSSLIKYSKILKIMSVIDSLVCILFYLGGLSFLIFLVALPITGYCAAKYFHRALVTAYSIYLILIIICRALLIGIFRILTYSIIQGLLILMELAVFIVTVKFYKGLGQLTKMERKNLRMMGNGYVVPSPEISRIDENN